jgi:hypothetical protein
LPAIAAVAATLTAGLAVPFTAARADDTPSPCAALKRIVAAAPQGFQSLGPGDGRAVAEPYGDDARCTPSRAAYRCEWTPHDAGSSAAALQGMGADIASCLPDATHDQNSPGRQHFYLGARGDRTEITAAAAGASRVTLTVSKP